MMLRSSTGVADAPAFDFTIADDHASVRLVVKQLVSMTVGIDTTAFTVFDTADDLLATWQSPSAKQRILVLDLVMPGKLKRVALVQALQEADPNARILVYSAYESAFLAQAVIDAGAFGYVAKTSPLSEFVNAIKDIVAGNRHIDPSIDLDRIRGHPWTSLTPGERAVLVAICHGYKPSEIVDATGRSYSTVQTHKYNALTKLGLRHGADLLPYMHATGLLQELDA